MLKDYIKNYKQLSQTNPSFTFIYDSAFFVGSFTALLSTIYITF